MKNFTYLVAGGLASLVRLFDIATKVWYLCTQEFESIELFIIFIVTLTVPFFVNLLVYFIIRHKHFLVLKKDAVLFLISEAFGLNFAIFSILDVFFWKDRQKFKLFYDLHYIAPFITSALQSVPLIIIQVFNTEYLDDWNEMRIIAVSATVGSFVIPLSKVIGFSFKSKAKVNVGDRIHAPNVTESHNKNENIVKVNEVKVFNLE